MIDQSRGFRAGKMSNFGLIQLYVWEPDIGEEIKEYITRMDERFPIPPVGQLIYKRREPYWTYLTERTEVTQEREIFLPALS